MFPSFTKTYHNRAYPSVSPDRPELSAKGKVVLVTGSGSGIGRTTAIAFARADAKAVVLCGRRVAPLEETKSKIDALDKETQVLVQRMDVGEQEDVAKVFQNVKGAVGEVDVVIHCAGLLAEAGDIKDITTKQFWTSFEVNVKGSFIISQVFLQHSKSSASNPKVLILISSANALLPATQIFESRFSPASYSISKLAEAKLAEYVAAENPSHFRAYALHPGLVETEMSIQSIDMTADPGGARNSITWDEPELSAGFMLWLSSKTGEIMPSGRFLFVNWDVEELEARAEELKGEASLLTMGCVGWPFRVIDEFGEG